MYKILFWVYFFQHVSPHDMLVFTASFDCLSCLDMFFHHQQKMGGNGVQTLSRKKQKMFSKMPEIKRVLLWGLLFSSFRGQIFCHIFMKNQLFILLHFVLCDFIFFFQIFHRKIFVFWGYFSPLNEWQIKFLPQFVLTQVLFHKELFSPLPNDSPAIAQDLTPNSSKWQTSFFRGSKQSDIALQAFVAVLRLEKNV